MSTHPFIKQAGARALFDAAEAGDDAELSRLLAGGADADARLAPSGETPLMRAAARGHEEAARVLLGAGADPSARRADGFTPLILAVFFGHEPVARLLVERGADPSARTGLGTTAARWAEARGFESMADLLRRAEAAAPRLVAPHVPVAAVRSDGLEIFSKGSARAAATGASGAAGLGLVQTFGGGAVREVPSGEPSSEALPSVGVGEPSGARSSAVSVRLGGPAPAHPSASTFRLGHFLSSWQGSLGALMLLLAFGVAVFALLRGGAETRPNAQPAQAPAPAAPQAAQAPAPAFPTPQPSPAFPTPDPQALVPGQPYPFADPGSFQPQYVPPGPVAPVPSDAPRDLTVVSESGGAAVGGATQPARRAEATPTPPARNDNAPEAAQPAGRVPRNIEPSEVPRPAQPAPAQNPPPAAPQPTPSNRPKVIQWPPQ